MNAEIDPSIARQPSPQTKNSQSDSLVASDVQRDVFTGTEEADRACLRRTGATRNKKLSNSFTTLTTSGNDRRDANGTAAAVGHGRGIGCLFPFSRRTLCKENDLDAIDSCSVSNFQQVFNEVKAENPLVSMGAVQQMTVRRFSELQKIQKEQQEELNRLAQETQDDERKIGLAAKTLNKFVDIIRVGTFALDEGEDHGFKAKGTYSSRSAHKSHLDDSCVSSSSSECAHDKTLALMKLAGFRRNSGSNVNRQSSQLSSAQSAFSDFNSSNDSLTLTKPRTANEMYAIAANEQGENMALRRSVGDFSAMMSFGDLSRRSGDSLMSDKSGLFLEEIVKRTKDAEAISDILHANSNDGVLHRDHVNDFVLAACAVCIDDPTNTVSGLANNRRQEHEETNEWGEMEKAASTMSSKFLNSKIGSIDQTHSCESDEGSAVSGLSDCTSACGSDGLIVGFTPRCGNSGATSDNLMEEGDGGFGSEGFAADFSAWENRCEG